jgi:hypothetical protein
VDKNALLSNLPASRRAFLTGAGCFAAAALLEGCGTPATLFADPDLAPSPLSASPGGALHHFIVTGQSLSCGDAGGPPITTSQPFNNKMFTYPVKSGWQSVPANYNAQTRGYSNLSLRPLINGPAPDGGGSPVETLSNGFADSMTARATGKAFAQQKFQQLLSCSGEGGQPYSTLAGPTDYPPNGSGAFLEMMSQVTLGQKLALAAGQQYSVPAMLLVHGENDRSNPQYDINLKTWQSDMQKGVSAITGIDSTIPIIAAQTQAQPVAENGGNDAPFVATAGSLGTLQAAIDNPHVICLACPEYMMAHGTIHMTADGYRHLGLMMAKAAFQIVVERTWWWPLMPFSAIASGSSIKIQYRVPHGPLVLDTSWVTDPGNYGFNFSGSGHTHITAVEVTGPAEITVSLSGAAAGGTISYALVTPVKNDTPLTQGYGPKAGPRGCVRDSDPIVSYYNDTTTGEPYPMQNYSVAWQATV